MAGREMFAPLPVRPAAVYVRELAPLFAGYDAGHYSLPDEVLDARAVLDRVQAESRVTPKPPQEDDAVNAAALRFAAGGDLDLSLSDVANARAARNEAEDRTRVLQAALKLAHDGLLHAVRNGQDEVVAAHLAPAQAEVIDAARAAHAAYAPHGDSAADLLAAPKPARDAYASLDGLARRWQVIRTAVDAVRSGQQFPEFALVRNADVIWPALKVNRQRAGAPPWPTTPREFLLWAVTTPGVEVWCPTARAQDAHGHDVFDPKPAAAVA